MKRADLSGTNMEIIISVVEFQPGETLARHIHHGEEAFYALQGATLETPDGKQIKVQPGAGGIFLAMFHTAEGKSLATRRSNI